MTTATNTVSFRPVSVKRSTVGFQKHADRGIRARVVAMVSSAGMNGITNDDLVAAWGGNGTTVKVSECMAILAGDRYGYAVEVLSDPTNKGLNRYRFAAGSANPTPAGVAPDASGKNAPDLNATPHVPVPDADAANAASANAVETRIAACMSADDPVSALADDDADDVRIGVYARVAVNADSPKTYVKEHVPAALRGSVREEIKTLSVK